MKVTWPVGKEKARIGKACRQHHELILGGSVLAIDPASRSMGWAIFRKGELEDSGTYTVAGKLAEVRLQKLRELLWGWEVNVLAVEKIRGPAHNALYWSVGVTAVSVDYDAMVEVPISFWKVLAKQDPQYEKTDENDAVKIGETVVRLAREEAYLKDAAAKILGGRK